jgi:Zinc-finger
MAPGPEIMQHGCRPKLAGQNWRRMRTKSGGHCFCIEMCVVLQGCDS